MKRNEVSANDLGRSWARTVWSFTRLEPKRVVTGSGSSQYAFKVVILSREVIETRRSPWNSNLAGDSTI